MTNSRPESSVQLLRPQNVARHSVAGCSVIPPRSGGLRKNDRKEFVSNDDVLAEY